MIDYLKDVNVDLISMNKYKEVYYDEISEDIDRSVGTNLKKKELILYEKNDFFCKVGVIHYTFLIKQKLSNHC